MFYVPSLLPRIGMHHQPHTTIWRQPKNTPIGEEETRTKRSPQTKTIEQNQSLDPKQQRNNKNKKETRVALSLPLFFFFFFGIIISHKKCSRKNWECAAAKSLAARLPDPTREHSFSIQSADLADSSSKISPCPLDCTFFNLLEIPSTKIFTW